MTGTRKGFDARRLGSRHGGPSVRRCLPACLHSICDEPEEVLEKEVLLVWSVAYMTDPDEESSGHFAAARRL